MTIKVGGGGGGVGPTTNLQVNSLGVGQAANGVAGDILAAAIGFAGTPAPLSKAIYLDASLNVHCDGGGFGSWSVDSASGEFIFGHFPVRFGATIVASLPAGNVGDVMYVTDGTAGLTFGQTVTGGHTTPYLVWFNGTNWTVIGA